MSLLPKTTFSQIASALSLLFLINLLISFLILRSLVIDPGAKQFADMIDNQVKLLEIQLAQYNPQQAKAWLNQAMPDSHFLIKKNTSNLAPLPDLPFYQAIQQHSRSLAGATDLIRISHADDQSWIWLSSAWMKNYSLGIPFQAYIQNIYRLIILIFAVSAMTTLITAYLITAYFLVPLKQLAKLAQDLPNIHKNLPLIKQKGPIEIQQLTSLVEQAAHQTRKVIQDRELILAGVSHDLRSPLACLRINTEWVKDLTLQQEMITDIEIMDQIIDDFLNFMRAGQSETPQAVNISEFLESILNNSKRQQQNIQLSYSENEVINLRPLAITRLISNLIDNAFKHAQPPISVKAYRNNQQFQIWVCDRGNGIAHDQIAYLLEPFVQGDKSRTQRGSGLGLAIAKRIAETHHCQFMISNRASGGLKVGIIFPTDDTLTS